MRVLDVDLKDAFKKMDGNQLNNLRDLLKRSV